MEVVVEALLYGERAQASLQATKTKSKTAREGDQQMVHAILERGTKPDTE